jgi:SAM-dependent methyltransferase
MKNDRTGIRDETTNVRDAVREGYAKVARGEKTTCCGPASSCGNTATADEFARGVGYSAAEVAALPEGANMGLSCGNPTVIAGLEEGEVVLDLGSGGGMDAFLAGPKVGQRGRVIGVDMTPDMLSKARANAAAYEKRTGLSNVEFRLGEIEHLPVADASVDVVISNCVINLSPDKAQVWREIARVLKPGGRVAVSDLALLRPLPAEVVAMVEAWIGCIAGAVLVDETERMAREVGLESIVLRKKPEYVRALQSFEDPLYQRIVEHLPAGAGAEAYLTSLDVEAHKPGKAKACCG